MSRAEAYCWMAHLLSAEGDALMYAWPRTDEQTARGSELLAGADACHEAARALDDDPELWRRAMDLWSAPAGAERSTP